MCAWQTVMKMTGGGGAGYEFIPKTGRQGVVCHVSQRYVRFG